MIVLFSADYHIKLKTKSIPEDWARNRYETLFKKLAELETVANLHIVGGDWFDKVPSLEELELYYDFVASRKCETIIFSGNHEALKKDTTFLSFLKSITSKLNPLVRVIDDLYTYKDIDFIPYNKLKEFEKGTKYTFDEKILATHVRGEIPPHVKSEINLELLDRWKLVLAGDLHSYDNCQRNILYPGSPITTSFHRSKVTNGVLILDTDTLKHEFIDLELPQLIRKTIKVGEPMPPTFPDHTIYELEGDMVELSSVQDHDLLDKKVVKRSVDTTLILTPEMSIEQEIAEYLSFVLELPQETVEKVIKEYHDNSKITGLE